MALQTTPREWELLEEKVHKLHTDIYLGGGKENPSMTVRVDRLEQYQKKSHDNFQTTKWMMLATMTSVLGSILTAFICYRLGIKI
jgi:hypothetical protein